jgi:hypothetical protein
MPSPLRIRLTPEEEQRLGQFRTQPQIPQRTRDRAEALRLSSKGWKVSEIAEYLNCAPNTVRQTFYRWLSRGIEGLFDAPRSGRKPVWQAEDLQYLEDCLEKEERTYNSRQLVEKLKKERAVEISRDRLRKILKKNWQWKRTRISLKGKQKEEEFIAKKGELETLKRYAEEGYVKLKYLDEAGFCLWSQVSYSYSKKGEQKQIRQTKKRGKRLSILGIMSEKESFE